MDGQIARKRHPSIRWTAVVPFMTVVALAKRKLAARMGEVTLCEVFRRGQHAHAHERDKKKVLRTLNGFS